MAVCCLDHCEFNYMLICLGLRAIARALYMHVYTVVISTGDIMIKFFLYISYSLHWFQC